MRGSLSLDGRDTSETEARIVEVEKCMAVFEDVEVEKRRRVLAAQQQKLTARRRGLEKKLYDKKCAVIKIADLAHHHANEMVRALQTLNTLYSEGHGLYMQLGEKVPIAFQQPDIEKRFGFYLGDVLANINQKSIAPRLGNLSWHTHDAYPGKAPWGSTNEARHMGLSIVERANTK